jgi:hypothetical protein
VDAQEEARIYIEVGAVTVHDTHDWTIHYARLCDLPLDPPG